MDNEKQQSWQDLGKEGRSTYIDRVYYAVNKGYIRVPFGREPEEFIEEMAERTYNKEVLGKEQKKDPDWWMRSGD